MSDTRPTIEATFAPEDIAAHDLDHAAWARAQVVPITKYWSGEEAPPARHAEARLLWTREALVARFVCRQQEPLVVSEAPRVDEKSVGLWNRDVCEIFVAPDAEQPEHYFEFEAAPTGEWLDLAIRWTPEARETTWDYRSGMTTASRVSEDSITTAIRIPWTAFAEFVSQNPHVTLPPRAGDRWRANLFRCVGAGEKTRGYLAWQPTRLLEPGFHLPEKFGTLVMK